jgi:hypothetical protein
MLTITRRFLPVALVAVLSLGLFSTTARAQQRIGPTVFPNNPPVNKNWLVAPGVTLKQWAWNTKKMGQAYSSIPPYMMGYNPYPQVINYGPSYYNPYQAYPNVNPYAFYSNMYNPYAAYGSFYTNPYNPYAAYGYNYLYR